MTKFLTRSDEINERPQRVEVRSSEINNLLLQNAFEIILNEDQPNDDNVLPGRFLLSINSNSDFVIKNKTNFVIGGRRERLKEFMVHSSQTLQPQ